MLHHDRSFIASTETERRAAAVRRHPPADAGEVERIMLAAAHGEGAGWNALVARFTARIRTVARIHRLAPHDVDDVLQTTWLRLLEHIDNVREPAAVGAWLDTTAGRESLRVLHGAKREQPTDEELAAHEVTEPGTEDEIVVAEQRAALTASVDRLPSSQRRLLAMLLADPPVSYAEISRALDMPIGSIGPTRARAVAHLRRDRDLIRVLGEER